MESKTGEYFSDILALINRDCVLDSILADLHCKEPPCLTQVTHLIAPGEFLLLVCDPHDG